MRRHYSFMILLTLVSMFVILIKRKTRLSRNCGCGSVVEHLLAKENVVGSNPITRLIIDKVRGMRRIPFTLWFLTNAI